MPSDILSQQAELAVIALSLSPERQSDLSEFIQALRDRARVSEQTDGHRHSVL